MNNKIKYINIAVTNRCNLTCKQCSIWQENPKTDISLKNIADILSAESLDNNVNIALTGGEPFLFDDLNNAVKLILAHKPGSLNNISTNGTLTEPVLNLFSEYKELNSHFSLHISIDGVNKHDKQRGLSLKTIKNTIATIRSTFPNIIIKLKFTITKLNYSDIIPTYKYAKQNNLGFKIKLVENAKNYTNKIKNSETFDLTNKETKSITRDLLTVYKDLQNKNQKDALFLNNTIHYLLANKNPLQCKTPFNRVFIMPDGSVYSCIHFDSLGNINNNTLDEIWFSDIAQSVRSQCADKGCNKCASYHGFTIT